MMTSNRLSWALSMLAALAGSALATPIEQGSHEPLRVLVRPAPVFSHWAFHVAIAEELAARGHAVAYLYSDEERSMLLQLGIAPNSSYMFKHPFPLQQMLVSRGHF